MIPLAISLLFCLIVILFFPFSFVTLLFSLSVGIVLLAIIAIYSKRHRRLSLLISCGIIIATALAIPQLIAYQTAFQQLPLSGLYQFTIHKLYPESHSAEFIITEPKQLQNYAIQLYNIPTQETLQLNATYESTLTIQPNRAKATFYKLNPRLNHLVHHRIGTANLQYSLKLINPPDKIMELRSNLSNYFQQHNFKNADLMSALSIGLTNAITPKTWDLLRQTGTIHLVAISGLHLTFIALWCFIILKSILGLCMIQKPAPYQIAAGISLVLAIGYALLAGMSLPTQRALIMFGIFMFALLMRYPILNFQSLATALFVILIIAPFSVVTIGFWLSFTAVLILMLLSQYRYSFITSLLLTQVIISTLAIPIVASFFNEVSLISPIANLFAIPWTTLLILPLLLIGIMILPISSTLGNIILMQSDQNISTLIKFLNIMNKIHYSHIEVPYIPLLSAIFITIFALILLTRLRLRYKLYSAVGMILLSLYTFKPNNDNYLLALPVGEGLSAILKSQDETLLFDTGPYFRGFDSAETMILPTLKNMNIHEVNHIVLSHSNQQHIGGTKTIRRAFPNAEIIAHSTLQPMLKHSINCQDYHFQSEYLTIDALPTQKSCALAVNLQGNIIWLIANITPTEWFKLLNTYPKPDVILFPNKGRSQGYKIPDAWNDVVFIGSTKNIHKKNQHHNIQNAYYGAVQVKVFPNKKLTTESASDKANFWWVNPI